MGDITGGPGGTSTTFTFAPHTLAIFSIGSRTEVAISWLLRSRLCLSCRLTWMSPCSGALRR